MRCGTGSMFRSDARLLLVLVVFHAGIVGAGLDQRLVFVLRGRRGRDWLNAALDEERPQIVTDF